MATMRNNKMKLSERVQNRDEKGRFATGFSTPAETPEVTQPVKSSTAAAKASVERDKSSVAIKLMEASTDVQENAIEVDKKLLKAVTDLTKTMQFGYKRGQEEKKKGLAGYVQGKISSVKSAFSLEGLAGMAGIQRDSGTLGGAVLGSVLQRKEKKKQEETEKAQYIAQFGEFTEVGRKLKETGGMKAVTAEGAKRFQGIKATTAAVSELQEKKKAAEKFGGNLSAEDEKRLKDAEYDKKFFSDYATPESKMKKKDDELMQGVAEGVKAEIATLSPEEKETLSKADPEYLKGVFEGALGSLTEINEKQLDQLVALVRASTMSEEDKLEAANKENIVQSIQDPKEEKKKEEQGGGMMKAIMDFVTTKLGGLLKMLPGMLAGALSGITSILGGIAKFIGPILGNAGKAIVSGAAKAIPVVAEAGKKVFDAAGKAVPAVKEMGAKAAEKTAGLGTKALGGLSKFGGLAKGVLGKLGPVAMAGMAAYDAVSGFNEAGANLGIEGREATLGEKLSSAAGSAASGLTFGLLGKDTASKGIASVFGAGPSAEKAATPNRVAQAVELAQNKEQLDQATKEATAAVSQPIVTNAPTTIINNSSTTSVRAPIRNTDHSYNNRLTRNFSY